MNSADPHPPMAVVTGAAQRLGKAIALELAQCGFVIGVHYHHSEQAARQTAAELREGGAVVELFQADLRSPTQIDDLFQHLDRLPYRLKVWINSAAVMERGDLRQLPVEEWDNTMMLNLRAPWLCAREAAKRMGEGGVIINLTDSGVRKTWSHFPTYAVSKAGLEMLTRILAKTLAPSVRVNAVAPGMIVKSDDLKKSDWERLLSRVPLGTAGTPDAVAKTVRFLIENTYITGETIVVDGGYQLV